MASQTCSESQTTDFTGFGARSLDQKAKLGEAEDAIAPPLGNTNRAIEFCFTVGSRLSEDLEVKRSWSI